MTTLLIPMKPSHLAYSYAFTQGRNNMHAQKNMNA